MNSHLYRSFDKDYRKLPEKLRKQFKARRNLFLTNQFHPLLNNHELHGKYDGCNSINVTGDYRAIYFMKNDIAVFIRVGTHSELFGK